MKNLVSVIIPVYNGARYLEACLQSVAAQTMTDFEVIVVDDGSDDGSDEIVETMALNDGRFRLVRTERGGVSRARNLGIDLARGEYLTFVDADDMLHPEALERLLEVARGTRSQVCVGAFQRSASLKDWDEAGAGTDNVRLMSYEEAMRQALYQKIILNSPCGMLIERRLLGVDVRFTPGIRFEDLDAFYRFYEGSERVAWVPERLYFYRQVPGSFIHSRDPQRLDVLEVTDRIVAYMEERHPALIEAALDRRFSANYNTLLRLLKYSPADKANIARCMKVVTEGRRRALSDPSVRLKNKLGALLSYGGSPMLRLLSRLLPLD